MWARYLAIVVVGCGYPAPHLTDARPDSVLIDAPAVPMGPHYHFVIDHENVPTNNTEARQYGMDLNGDGTVDNQLGMVFGSLSSMGLNVQATTSTDVDKGSILMLADVQTLDF